MRTIVRKQIHGSFAAASSTDKYVFKVFNLPFAPFVGLSIKHKTKKGETDYIEIEEVAWDIDSKEFLCYAPSDKEIYEAVLRKETHRNIDEIIQEYIEADWLIEERAKAKKE